MYIIHIGYKHLIFRSFNETHRTESVCRSGTEPVAQPLARRGRNNQTPKLLQPMYNKQCHSPQKDNTSGASFLLLPAHSRETLQNGKKTQTNKTKT